MSESTKSKMCKKCKYQNVPGYKLPCSKCAPWEFKFQPKEDGNASK